ncbi:hypothetical protein K8R62_04415 [bacterium]|nr:hypothetical protein [bacterium]
MSKEVDIKMHTAEHLLNGTMVKLVGSDRCFSAHIEKKKSKCDYYLDEDPKEKIKLVEDKVNEIIRKNLPVSEEFISLKEAGKRFDLKRVPESALDQNEIRIIKIGDYDAVICKGLHVKITSEIGEFKIISYDFKDGVLRIRYKLI